MSGDRLVAGNRPAYRQIADQIALRIEAGDLAVGDRLPTVRALASELGVTRPTVHKAYRLLIDLGTIESTVGRGTFVARRRAVGGGGALTADDVMREIQRHRVDDTLRNLAHAEPAPEMIPFDELWRALDRLRDEVAMFHYQSSQGDPELLVELEKLVRRRGIDASRDDIVVTSGVTQGLSLAATVLAQAGDCVAVEQPTYLGLLQILEARGLRPVPVSLDDDGPQIASLERVVAERRPRFFYTVASFHNPTGRSMTLARRRELLAVAKRRRLTIVEDDIYHRLAYDGPPPAPLASMDEEGLVVYLDGLSKVAFPGARIGYMVLPRRLREAVLSQRRAADMCGPPLIQRAVARFLADGGLDRYLARALPFYRRRRDALLAALTARMPAGVGWSVPAGGFCCWLQLPQHGRFDGLYRAALGRGVVIAPGDVFVAEPDERAHVRLCFGNSSEKDIDDAVAILARLIEERLDVAPMDTTAEWTSLV